MFSWSCHCLLIPFRFFPLIFLLWLVIFILTDIFTSTCCANSFSPVIQLWDRHRPLRSIWSILWRVEMSLWSIISTVFMPLLEDPD